jgi:polyisoprenoid-binding protein YceI
MRAHRIVTRLIAAALMAVCGPALAGADTYQIDTSHSGVEFKVRHMLVTNVKGQFDTFEGTISYDAENVENSSVEVTIQTASINTRNEKRDKHLQSGDFLAAEEFPTITFKSTTVKKEGDGFVAVGDLTIRGVTKEVEIPFEIAGPVTNPWGQQVIGVEGRLTINRMDYGAKWNKAIETGGAVVSEEVKIELNIEAAKAQE